VLRGPWPIPQPTPGYSGVPGGNIQGHPIPLSRVTGLVLVALDQTPQTPEEILQEIQPYERSANVITVKDSLEELKSLGAARQEGSGWVRVPGYMPVGMAPPRPQ